MKKNEKHTIEFFYKMRDEYIRIEQISTKEIIRVLKDNDIHTLDFEVVYKAIVEGVYSGIESIKVGDSDVPTLLVKTMHRDTYEDIEDVDIRMDFAEFYGYVVECLGYV